MALVPVLKKDDYPTNLEPSMSGKEFNALIFPPPDIRSKYSTKFYATNIFRYN